VVVGGGLAGIAAATVLAERGAAVTIVERETYLGGRVGAWAEKLDDGEPFEMERGFHAFFRQYYTLRRLLRRIDPDLQRLTRLEDYPILGPGGTSQSFKGLPRRTPLNIIELTRRSQALGLRQLLAVNKVAALEMLAFDPVTTYERHDGRTAKQYLDSLNFPTEARRLLFDVFAHSFFNPEAQMSAAELLMMFHFYFTGNPEGLVFDVLDQPFGRALWEPFTAYLESHGAQLRLGVAARHVQRLERGYRVVTDDEVLEADLVVLALPVGPLERVVRDSSGLDDVGFHESIESLELTLPFAVHRLWLDRVVDRPPFVGTTGVGLLDNISVYDRIEDESRSFRERRGGSVVELHAYAVPHGLDDEAIRADLTAGLHALYPETRGATVPHERYLRRQDCPAFGPGSHARRPTVHTPFAGLALAGDFLKLPFPSALMERAAASGVLAANHVLARLSVRSEPVQTVPPRGLLASVF
jgi:isorenieratene synthase